MGLSIHELGPFTEGVNLVDPPTKLNPNELRECRNWRTGVRGDFYKRPGNGDYGSGPTKVNGDVKVNLLLRYYRSDGSKKLIAAAGGKLKFGNDSTGAWTQIDIDGVAGNNMSTILSDWMVYKNRLYITDGTRAQRYNNIDNIYAGHFIHSAPTLAQNLNGNLTALATYKYFVTSVAGDMGEGGKGAEASFPLTGANDGIDLSAISVAPAKHEETTKRIYRTKANGTLFYFLTEIATGTTVFGDTLADSSLGAEFVPVHSPYIDSKYVIMGHDERAYWLGREGVNASIVDVSEVGFPDRIKDLDFFPVANNDGDRLTGVGLVPGGLVFFKRTSIWLLRAFGFGLINIYPKEKRGAGVGTVSPFSIVTTPVGLIFLSQRGEVYRFDGTNIKEIGRKVASEFKGMTQSAIENIVACYHDYRYQISYDYKGQKGYNWKTLEYDTLTDKWEGPHENGDLYTPSYYSVWDSQLDKGELYWGEAKAATGSFVYGRSEFTKLDRSSKFLSRAKTGSSPLAKLGRVNTTKIFIHGEVTSDIRLTATHINEINERTSVELSTPTVGIVSKLNGTDDLGPSGGVVFKLGGTSAQVLEGSFSPAAGSRIPVFEISDGGTAVDAKMNIFQVLVDALLLK